MLRRFIGRVARRIADRWSPIPKPRERGLLMIGGPLDGKRISLETDRHALVYARRTFQGHAYYADVFMKETVVEDELIRRLLDAGFHCE